MTSSIVCTACIQLLRVSIASLTTMHGLGGAASLCSGIRALDVPCYMLLFLDNQAFDPSQNQVLTITMTITKSSSGFKLTAKEAKAEVPRMNKQQSSPWKVGSCLPLQPRTAGSAPLDTSNSVSLRPAASCAQSWPKPSKGREPMSPHPH